MCNLFLYIGISIYVAQWNINFVERSSSSLLESKEGKFAGKNVLNYCCMPLWTLSTKHLFCTHFSHACCNILQQNFIVGVTWAWWAFWMTNANSLKYYPFSSSYIVFLFWKPTTLFYLHKQAIRVMAGHYSISVSTIHLPL